MFVDIAHASGGIIDGAPRLSELALKVLQWLLSVAGILAFLGVLLGAFRYFYSNGDIAKSEQAMKAINAAIIGVIFVLISLILTVTISAVVS